MSTTPWAMARTTQRFLVLALFAAAIAHPGSASADQVCGQDYDDPIPDCEPQVQQPELWHWGSLGGWAYYCTGDHPYFWTYYSGSYTWDNSCFTLLAIFEEGQIPSKADFTIGNWCLKAESLTVTLGCSKQPSPTYAGKSCTTYAAGPVGDPGCTQTSVRDNCYPGEATCYLFSTEQCSNGTVYDCTAIDGIVWCYQCPH